MSAEEASNYIKKRALEIGFDAVGICRPLVPKRNQAAYDAFIKAGWQGSMDWMAERAAERSNPKTLWPEVRSLIMLAVNYGPEDDPLKQLSDKRRPVLSCYAQNRDYHDIVKKRLKTLGREIAARYGAGIKVFVDTAPVMEKPLAEQAGLGWQGKHSNLVSRDFGSWLFLAEIYTTLDLMPDTPEQDHCGSCQSCMAICPTQAIVAPYKLDARRCLAYLNIEHKGPIPRAFRAAMGNRLYGCDDCLAVCPWNKFAQFTKEQGFIVRDTLQNLDLTALLALDDARFRVLFSKSPIKRLGSARFLRNAAIVAGNSGEAALTEPLKRLLEHESYLVRGAAIWALRQLMSAEEWHDEKELRQPQESHALVLEEWV